MQDEDGNKSPVLTPEKRGSIFNMIKEEQEEATKKITPEDSPDKIIKAMHNTSVVHVATTDENVQKQFMDQAKKTVANELGAIDQENVDHRQKATYNANADACKNYGIEESVPLWEIKLMRAGSAFWFILYFLFASVTICPVSVFAKGIRAFIKSTWLAVVFAIICYLLIVAGLPVIVNLLRGGR